MAELETHSRDRAIVAAVAGLARELGLPVLAERFETESQLAGARAEQASRVRNQWILVAVLVIALTALLAAVLPPFDGVPVRRHF